MTWITPITDREYQDIVNRTAKGYLNTKDLKRIEGNIKYIADRLNFYGYNSDLVVKTNWDIKDFPFESRIKRIRNNVNTLINVYHSMESDVIKYHRTLDYKDVNLLEKHLLNCKELIPLMEETFRYCGDVISGDR